METLVRGDMITTGHDHWSKAKRLIDENRRILSEVEKNGGQGRGLKSRVFVWPF